MSSLIIMECNRGTVCNKYSPKEVEDSEVRVGS